IKQVLHQALHNFGLSLRREPRNATEKRSFGESALVVTNEVIHLKPRLELSGLDNAGILANVFLGALGRNRLPIHGVQKASITSQGPTEVVRVVLHPVQGASRRAVDIPGGIALHRLLQRRTAARVAKPPEGLRRRVPRGLLLAEGVLTPEDSAQRL